MFISMYCNILQHYTIATQKMVLCHSKSKTYSLSTFNAVEGTKSLTSGELINNTSRAFLTLLIATYIKPGSKSAGTDDRHTTTCLSVAP